MSEPKNGLKSVGYGAKLIRRLGGIGLCLGLSWGLLPAPALAVDWLVLVIDRSNSIDAQELRLQREAYGRLLSDQAVLDALRGTQVAIVEFDTRPEIVSRWADAEDAGRRYSRRRPEGSRGQTGIADAMATALDLLTGKSGRLVIDISGDGRENVDERLLPKVRRKAAAAAVEVNGLTIVAPETAGLSTYYDQNVVNGFVLSVDRWEDFYGALRRKLFLEVADREPGPGGRQASIRSTGDDAHP